MSSRTEPTIEGYRLLDRIASGGSGDVYLATPHAHPNTQVAIKILRAGVSIRQKELSRFAREGRVAQALKHPNILPVLELGQCESGPYLVLDHVQGATLHHRIHRRVPRAVADEDGDEGAEKGLLEDLRVLVSIADALAFAHDHGIVHRDVKPGNILVREDGHPFLIDFGLARSLSSESTLTSSGVVMGTPWYMAPEQLVGDRARIGPASDIYGLGATLYEAIAGRPPFVARTFEALREKVLTDEPTPLRKLAPRAPRGVDAIVERALEKRPEHRHPNAAAFRDELKCVIDGLQPRPLDLRRVFRRTARSFQRRKVRLLAGGVAASALIISALAWLNAVKDRSIESEEIATLFRQSSQAAALGEFDDALYELGLAREKRPRDPEVEMRLAATYSLFELGEQAKDAVRRAREKGYDPSAVEANDPRAAVFHAIDEVAHGNLDAALPLLERATGSEASSRDVDDTLLSSARLLLYQVQHWLGRDEQAPGSLARYLSGLRMGEPARFLAEAWACELSDDLAGAERWLNRPELAETRSSVVAYRRWRSLGRVHIRAKRFEDAERSLRKALALQPDDPICWTNLGIAAFRREQWKKALECADKALSIDPGNTQAHLIEGNIASRESRWSDARAHFRAAIARRPNLDPEHVAECHLLFLEGEASRDEDPELPKARFDECLKICPTHVGALFYRGQQEWQDAGNWEAAEKFFIRALEAFASKASPAPSKLLMTPDLRSSATLRGIHVGLFAVACKLGHVERARESLDSLLSRRDELGSTIEDVLNLAESLAERSPCRNCALALDILREHHIAERTAAIADAAHILARIQALCGE